MAKKFISSDIFQKLWFRRLDPEVKLFFLYLISTCDLAGFLEYDPDRIEFDLGISFDVKLFSEKINATKKNRIVWVDNKTKIWIPDYVKFQYNELSENSKPHLAVIKRLKSLNCYTLYKGYANTTSSIKYKDKEKAIDTDKDKYIAKPKNHEMVLDVFKELNILDPKENSRKFFDHYEANGWYRGKTKIKNWKRCISTWSFEKNTASSKYRYSCLDHPEIEVFAETRELKTSCPICNNYLKLVK